jgi:hypothetical protein
MQFEKSLCNIRLKKASHQKLTASGNTRAGSRSPGFGVAEDFLAGNGGGTEGTGMRLPGSKAKDGPMKSDPGVDGLGDQIAAPVSATRGLGCVKERVPQRKAYSLARFLSRSEQARRRQRGRRESARSLRWHAPLS